MQKADKIDLEKLYELKSNKLDTDTMLTCQQLMTKYFKQIMVLFIEIVNFNTLRPNDTKQAHENRQFTLVSQVQNLANWVMKFDPEEFVKEGRDVSVADENDTFFKNYTEDILSDILAKRPVVPHKHYLKQRSLAKKTKLDFTRQISRDKPRNNSQ